MAGPTPRPQGDHSQAEVDPAVIARAARGDAQAFSEIYGHSAPRIRRYVRTIVWNRWDAEDVTQEVFVKILMALDQFDPSRAAFSAWTLRVARNAAIDHLRREQSRAGWCELDQRTAVDDVGQRCGESLRQVLGELNHRQREVLVLRALAGFTPHEVAKGVQATRGSINTQYHRARIAARDRLFEIDAAPSIRPSRRAKRKTAVLPEAA
jgi:RNA polymerase sigma-70 factor, ECF subfamily